MATRSSKQRLFYGGGDGQPVNRESGVGQVFARCILQYQHTSQVQTWQNRKARDETLKFGIAPSDTICRPCHDDLCRISTDPSHVPRWKKKSQETVKCNAHGCSDVCFSKLQVLDIKQHFEEIELQFDGYIPFPTSPLQPSLLHCVQSNSASAEKLLNVWSFREA